MKSEDFERLKAVCEKEGFEVNVQFDENATVLVAKKDPWDGVEFAEAVKGGSLLTIGKIYRIINKDSKRIGIYADNDKIEDNITIICFKPSTEQDYIDQLKKEAFERFGEIKEGDVFDLTSINKNWEDAKRREIRGSIFEYFKAADRLYIGSINGGTTIYQQGKWATRVKERVEVNYGWTDGEVMGTETPICLFGNKDLSKSVFRGMNDNEIGKAFKFLASQLEAYLNK